MQRDGALALIGYGLASVSVGVLVVAAGVVIRTLQHVIAIFTPG